jgi:hypothetical protein
VRHGAATAQFGQHRACASTDVAHAARSSAVRPRRVGPVVAAVTAACLVFVATGAWASPPPGTPAQVAALVAGSRLIKSLPSNLSPSVAAASNDTPEVQYPFTKDGCASIAQCVFGDKASSKVIVLFGDSHAAMWLPALLPIAARDNYRVVLLFTLGCPAVDVTIWNKGTGTDYTACNTARSSDISQINGLKPKVILLASRSAQAKSSAKSFFTNAQWEAGLKKTITLLKPSKAKLAVVGDITLLNVVPPMCLAASPTSVQRCSTANPNPIKHNQGHQSAERAAAAATKTLYVNTIPWLCTKTCSPVIGSMLAYSDQWHITVTYATYLSTVFADSIKKLLT